MKDKSGIIVFARMGSKRFPGKVLQKINNISNISYVISRAKKIFPGLKIVVATTRLKADNKIANYCKKNKINFYRGNNLNVLIRAIKCCDKFKFTSFIRVCADRIFFDYNLAKKMFKIFKKGNFDIVTNSFIKSFPKGLSCEILKLNILKKNYSKIKKKSHKEHICNYFYENPDNFAIKNIKSKHNSKIINLSLALDTKEDFVKIKNCYKHFSYRKLISTKKVIKYYIKKKL